MLGLRSIVNKITDNLYQIEQNIKQAKERAHRTDSVHIIAVTKEVNIERTVEAIDAGLIHLGENRPDGLNNKINAIDRDVNWHYIGSLQTRKVKLIIDQIDYLHSLDRISLAEEIQKRAKNPIKCFVQANVSGEQSKHGLAQDEVISFIKELEQYDKIQVVGLMTMAPNTDDEQVIREVFKKLKMLQQQVANLQLSYAPCTELSMGMSNDYMIAVEEGATFVRVGTALVG